MENPEILQGFADNVALMETVKGLLLSQFSTDNLKATDDDILLGQMVRARLVGKQAVEDAFKIIAKYQSSSKSNVGNINPAR